MKSSKVRLVGREIRRKCSIAVTELNWNELDLGSMVNGLGKSLSCEPDDECCKGK